MAHAGGTLQAFPTDQTRTASLGTGSDLNQSLTSRADEIGSDSTQRRSPPHTHTRTETLQRPHLHPALDKPQPQTIN